MVRKLTGIAGIALVVVTCSWCGFPFPFNFPGDMEELGDAEFGMKGGPKALEAKMCRLLEGVALSAEQRAELRASYADVQQELAPVKAELESFREEMHALWTAEEPDEEAILAKFAEVDPLRAQVFDALASYYAWALGTLTPEQKTLVADKLGTCVEGEAGADEAGNRSACGGHGGGNGQGDGNSGRGGRGGMGGGGQNEMGLSYDQMYRIFELKQSLQEEIAPYREQIKEHKAEMCELWAEDPVDVEAVTAHFDDIAPVRDDVREIVVSFRLDVIEILTPEQRERMSERIAEKRQQAEAASSCAWLSDGSAGRGNDADEQPDL